MIHPIDQARSYISKIAPAVSGSNGHDQTYHVAMVLVEGFGLPAADAKPLMLEYSARCCPPWSEREIDHKIASAQAKVDQTKVGKMVRKGIRGRFNASPLQRVSTPSPAPAASASPKSAKKPSLYEVPDSLELPEPIPDGCRRLLAAAFEPGEGVRIARGRPDTKANREGKEVPEDGGIVLSREEWLRKLDANGGDPNKFLRTSEKNGLFVSLNPMKPGGTRDQDVTAYRHVLLESDTVSLVEQWGIITQSRIPCSAVILSGGKSVHAWVKVDAKTRDEFDARVKLLYDHFESNGFALDPKNKNPSRFSRLPFCERGNARQELLAVNVGLPSWEEWIEQTHAEDLGEIITIDDIDKYDPAADDTLLIGNDWLCRGEAGMIVGPSGVGKSSLVQQMCFCWATGKAAFGIKATKPLRIMFIQAENQKRYLKKVLNGIRAGLEILPFDEYSEMLRENFTFVHDTCNTADSFIQMLKRRIDKFHPDLVVIDPLLSFLGGDINKVEVVSQFCRNWLNPILDSRGVAALIVHHTGKPSSDPKAKKGWTQTDFSYSGLGSSELTNWARAIVTLQSCGQGAFQLLFTKRQMESGACHPSREPTSVLWLKHATGKIFWEQNDPPEVPASESKGGAPNKTDEVYGANLSGFLAGCKPEGESHIGIATRLAGFAAEKLRKDISPSSCKKIISRLFEESKMLDKKDGKYFKGPNA